MPLRPIAIGLALVALAIALWLLIAAARRRRWTSIFRVVPALALLALVAFLASYIFGLNAPHPFFNRAASVPAGTIVYVLSDPNGADSHVTLFAVQGQTGKTLWQRPMSDSPGVITNIVSAGSAVYAASYSFQPDQSGVSHILALDGITGSILWQRTLPGSYIPGQPLVAEGTLFLATGEDGPPPMQQVFALRPSDGSQLWSVRVGSYPVAPHLLAAPGLLYVQTSGPTLQARRLTDGALLWSTNRIQGQVMAGSDAVYDLSVYGSITAYNARTGAKLWQYGDHDFFHTGVFSGDTLYVATQQSGSTGDASGHPTNPETVYALDAATGRLRWTFATQSYNAVQLVAGPDAIYIGGDDGIHALRPADGSLLWHSDPRTGWTFSRTSPIVGSTLYVTALQILPPETYTLLAPQHGQVYLYAVSAADGSANWGVPVGPVLTIR